MKHKPKLLMIFLAMILFAGMNAQQSVNAGGGDAAGSGGTVNFSVGQVVYISFTGSGGNVIEGVQQPYQISIVGIDKEETIALSMAAFPNPVLSVLQLKVEDREINNHSYELYEISGKVIIQGVIAQTITELNMDDLANGTYYLRVLHNKKELKTFQIIKHD